MERTDPVSGQIIQMKRVKELLLKRAAVLDFIQENTKTDTKYRKPVDLGIREYLLLSKTPTSMILHKLKEKYGFGIENE